MNHFLTTNSWINPVCSLIRDLLIAWWLSGYALILVRDCTSYVNYYLVCSNCLCVLRGLNPSKHHLNSSFTLTGSLMNETCVTSPFPRATIRTRVPSAIRWSCKINIYAGKNLSSHWWDPSRVLGLLLSSVGGILFPGTGNCANMATKLYRTQRSSLLLLSLHGKPWVAFQIPYYPAKWHARNWLYFAETSLYNGAKCTVQ